MSCNSGETRWNPHTHSKTLAPATFLLQILSNVARLASLSCCTMALGIFNLGSYGPGSPTFVPRYLRCD